MVRYWKHGYLSLKQNVFFGRAYITDITLNGPVEGVATYSVTVNGAGPYRFTDPTLCVRFLITLTTAGAIEWQDCDTGGINTLGFSGPTTFYQCATIFGGLPQISITSGTGTIEEVGYCSE